MKVKIFSSIFFCIFFIVACKSKQKTAPVAAEPSSTTPVRPANGIYAPGAEEGLAIQKQFPGTSEAELLEGYKLYTGTCTDCHQPKSIYSRPESSWPRIIGEMSMRSHITTKQSDAILKYVLAIKATQVK